MGYGERADTGRAEGERERETKEETVCPFLIDIAQNLFPMRPYH
jgi:hypothetical protein